MNKLSKWFSKQKIGRKVSVIVLMISVLYVAVFYVTFRVVTKDSMIENTISSNMDTMINISNNITTEIDSIDNMSQIILFNDNVMQYLHSSVGVDLEINREVVRSIHDITNFFKNISSVYIFNLEGDYIDIATSITYANMDIIMDSDWQEKINEKAGGYILLVDGDGAFTKKSKDHVISMIRLINDYETQLPIGYLVINLDLELFENMYSSMNNEDRSFSIEYEESSGNGSQYINNEIVSYYHIEGTPMTLHSVEGLNGDNRTSKEFGRIGIIFIALTLIAISVVGVFISKSIIGPIKRLALAMKSVDSGWLKRISLKLPEDEIGYLMKSYNQMLVEINNLIEVLVDKEKSIQRAELEILQEQIKPHFLYNTLGSIGELALSDEGDMVYDAIETLANFYRLFLNNGEMSITLDNEVKIVKAYLKLQQLRYEDSFEALYEIDESLLDIKIPKLTLQPIVENSLYHGIRPKGECCKLKISIYKFDEEIRVEVEDTGIGMSKDTLEGLMTSSHDNHFGFKKTMERLQYFYGKEDIYEVQSKEGYYTRVIMKISR